jgi:outer membrane protein OmpA-like peptidoglycan-associated protein
MTTAAMAVVDDVVTALKSFAQPLVSIVGHTDTSGSVAYNQSLSERRANSVESAILSRASNMGVTVGSVTKAGRSESELAVQTGDGVREPRNRRATIAISE